MGCTSNIDAFLSRIGKVQGSLAGAARDGVNAAALAYTTAIRTSINSAAPGGLLRGVGRNGAKVRAGFSPAASATVPVAIVRARGPLHLLERDTRAHAITPRRARALSIGHDVFAASAAHPGSRGKHPFERGVAAGAVPARAAMEAALVGSVRKALG